MSLPDGQEANSFGQWTKDMFNMLYSKLLAVQEENARYRKALADQRTVPQLAK